jgi:hypothetical protein
MKHKILLCYEFSISDGYSIYHKIMEEKKMPKKCEN